MSSDEEEFDDDTTDYDEFDTTDDDDDDDEVEEEEEEDDDDDEFSSQPIHFRECLRLLDAALTSGNPPVLPQWCSSEQVGTLEDPMLLIHGQKKCLALPMDKPAARSFISHAQPFEMKIDLVDGITFAPSARQVPAKAFSILNPRWSTQIEPFLKRECVGRSLQLDPNQIELKVSTLLLLESSQFPRQFHWSPDQQHPNTIAKLFLSLPSLYTGGKETVTHYNEKHVFDLSHNDAAKSSFYTIVPTSSECKHEIDFISHGYKLILVYDIVPLTSTIYYNVDINEATLARVGRMLETWSHGLEHDYHSYASKIIVPFSDTFHLSQNPLLHGIDRVTGTILRRTIEQHHAEKFLLYQGVIQPNRSNDGTVHACRLLTDLKLNTASKAGALFDKIDVCLGNCNETYSGNIFLRKSRSEQGRFVPVEQFSVPIWCVVPVSQKYDLLLDNVPRVITHLERNLIPHPQHHAELFLLIDWLLTTPKKIHFNTKSLLHQLLRLSTSKTVTYDFIIAIRQLLEHKKFLEQFFPMVHQQEYDDIVYLLKYSPDTKIQLYLHQVLRAVLKRRSRDSDRVREAIKFIGMLSTRHVDSSFLLVLIHELLSYVFKPNTPNLPITDLANLLALLSISIDSYEPSCRVISQQIIRQIKITTTATTMSPTVTSLLRTVLVPTLVQIHRQFVEHNHLHGKRKRHSTVDFPPWFLSLYQTCLSLLTAYCNSAPSIPTYDNLPGVFDAYCGCSVCEQLLHFLRSSKTFERTFYVPKDKIYHFNASASRFTPLVITTKSMTSDKAHHQINIMKMSAYDEETCRENSLLRSLLSHIPISNDAEDRAETTRSKRFKPSP